MIDLVLQIPSSIAYNNCNLWVEIITDEETNNITVYIYDNENYIPGQHFAWGTIDVVSGDGNTVLVDMYQVGTGEYYGWIEIINPAVTDWWDINNYYVQVVCELPTSSEGSTPGVTRIKAFP